MEKRSKTRYGWTVGILGFVGYTVGLFLVGMGESWGVLILGLSGLAMVQLLLILGNEVREKAAAWAQLQARDQILETLIRVDEYLLRESDYKEAVEGALALIGKGFGLGFVGLYRLLPVVGRARTGQLMFEWAAQGVDSGAYGRLELMTYAELLPEESGGRVPVETLMLSAAEGGIAAEFVEQFAVAALTLSVVRTNRGERMLLLMAGAEALDWEAAQGSGWLKSVSESIGAYIENKRVEEALMRAQEAAVVADRAKSEFLAMMSHEIRTPMNAILGFAELAKQTAGEAVQAEYLGIIERSGHDLLELINNILDYSRLGSLQVQLERRPFRMETVVIEVLEIIQMRTREKGIELKYSLGTGSEGYYMGDPLRLRQVLLNLMTNAVKFTGRGHVELSVQVRPLGGTQHRAEIVVADTGIGIEKDFLPHLFEPFRQADSSTTREYGGTGLGLTIVDRLVDLMGGKIRVESAVGKGTRFTVELPYEVSDQKEVPVAITTAYDAEDHGFAHRYPLEILVVEDDRNTARLIIEVLKRLGYSAPAVDNGMDALDRLRRAPYDLVLMDLHLPRMDGLEITRRIREGEAGGGNRGVAIVAMTAAAGADGRMQALASGVDHYLAKPLKVAGLKAVIEQVCTGGRRNGITPG